MMPKAVFYFTLSILLTLSMVTESQPGNTFHQNELIKSQSLKLKLV
jgi:hypothetical protein